MISIKQLISEGKILLKNLNIGKPNIVNLDKLSFKNSKISHKITSSPTPPIYTVENFFEIRVINLLYIGIQFEARITNERIHEMMYNTDNRSFMIEILNLTKPYVEDFIENHWAAYIPMLQKESTYFNSNFSYKLETSKYKVEDNLEYYILRYTYFWLDNQDEYI